MSFVDFNELKARVSLGDAVRILGLTLKQNGNQWRGPCPACKGSDQRSLVVTESKGFYCFAAKKGGDQIGLAQHILGIGAKEAAQALAGATVPVARKGTVPGTVPESGGGEETQKLQPLSYLEAEHPAVDAVGFSAEVAQRLGIGYAGKGMMRGTVAVPVRDERGTLLGYIGITEARLPPDFTPNVVPFAKKSA